MKMEENRVYLPKQRLWLQHELSKNPTSRAPSRTGSCLIKWQSTSQDSKEENENPLVQDPKPA